MTSRPTGKRRKMAGVNGAPRSKSDDPDISEPTTGTDNPAHDLAEDRDPQSQVHLREAIECISEGFALYDAEDRLVLCNDRLRELYDRIADKLVPGTPFAEILRAAVERGQFPEAVGREEEFLAQRSTAHTEIKGPRRRQLSTGRWVSVSNRRTRDGGTVGVHTDVTELVQRGNELADQSALFQATLDSMEQGITMIDPQLNVLVANRKMIELLDLPPELTAPGTNLEDLFRYNARRGEYGPGDEDEQVRERVDLARRLEPHRFQRTRPDGTVLEIRGNPMPDGGVVTTYSDVTDERRGQAALRESEARLRTLVSNAPVVLWALDRDGVFTLSEGKGLSRMGLEANEAVGRSVFEVYRNVPQVLEDTRRALAGETVHSVVEVGKLWFEAWLAPVRDQAGAVTGVIGVASDITERKCAEQALRQKTEHLELLKSTAVAANEATTLEDAIQDALDSVCAHTGWPVGHAYTLSRDGTDELLPTELWHLGDRESFERFHAVTMATSFPKGVGLPGRVLATRRPVWIADVTEDATFPRAKLAQDIGVRAGFAFPVLAGNDVVAVLEFFSEDATPPDEALLEIMAQVGAQLGRVAERNRSEEALRRSEERYRTLVETMNDGLAVTDKDSVLTYVNDRFCELLGYARDELIGRSTLKLFLDDDRDIIEEQLARRRKGESQPYEVSWTRQDGDKILTIVSPAAVFDDDARYSGAITVVTDITDRKRTEEALRESEARYRQLYEQSPVAIWEEDWSEIKEAVDDLASRGITDLRSYFSQHPDEAVNIVGKLKIANPNRAAVEIYRLPNRESVNELSMVETFTDQDLQTMQDMIIALASGEVAFTAETIERRHDGSEVELNLRAALPPQHRDDWKQILYTIEDISERKQAERALRESKERFRAIAVATPMPIVISRLSDRLVLFCNEEFARLHGKTSKEIVGRSAPDLWADPAARQEMVEELQREGRVRNFEALGKNGDGSLFWALGNAEIVHLDGQQCLIAGIYDITDRRNAEEALRESEKRFRDLVEGSIQGIVIHRDWNFLFVNQATVEIFGFGGIEEFIAQGNLESLIAPHERERLIGYRDARLRGEPAPQMYDFEGIRQDGAPVWLQVTSSPVDWKGERAIQSTFVDITERKRAEQALVEREHRLQSIADNLPGLVFQRVRDRHGRLAYTYVSGATRRLLGYDSSAVLTNPSAFLDRIHPDDWDEFMARIEESAEKQTPMNLEVRHMGPDGNAIWMQTISSPRRTEDGGVVWDGVAIDITDRRNAEDELRDNEEKFRSLIENAQDIITVIDPDGTIKYESPAIENVLGYAADQRVGTNGFDIIHPDDVGMVAKVVAEGIRTPGASASTEFRARHKDGSWRTLEAIGKNLLDHAGIGGIIITSRDITERRRVEDQKAKLERQLRQAQKMEAIGTLAGGIAHDFNNILAAMISYTQLAIESVPDKGQPHDDLKQVMKAIERAKNLVKQILAFSRQNASERKPAELYHVAEEVLPFIRASVASTIEIRQRIDKRAGVVVADSTQIHQVLMNLCANAADAIGDGPGVIDVSLAAVTVDARGAAEFPAVNPGRYVELAVKDTGCGMDEATVERIFEPFFTTKELGKGTGLGLAAVHGIVADHGGAIRVDSEPGRGTTITILFPRADEADQGAGWRDEEMPGGDERVLLVDDEDAVVQSEKRLLELRGYKVWVATSSIKALDMFRARPQSFDVVIVDQTMPEMTGEVLAKELLRVRPEIPIILCSGLARPLRPQDADALGIREFLLKPINPCDLAKAVRRVLDQHGAAENKKKGARRDHRRQDPEVPRTR